MISIVMAYYNRKEQFEQTMLSIEASKQKDIEVIVIDDGSKKDQRLELLQKRYSYLKVYYLKKKDKWWVCNCIPYNVGISKAKGNIIVIQNPECYHVGDVLTYIVDNLTDKNFLAISAYAIDVIHNLRLKNQWCSPEEFLKKLPQNSFDGGTGLGWYNHPKYRPVYYHFCAAITRKNMNKLGGFDERYSMGIAYDDNEFVERVKRLNVKMKIPTDVSVIHQWHDKVDHFNVSNYGKKHALNKYIFEKHTLKEKSIRKEITYFG